jgi:hypothetical protein
MTTSKMWKLLVITCCLVLDVSADDAEKPTTTTTTTTSEPGNLSFICHTSYGQEVDSSTRSST